MSTDIDVFIPVTYKVSDQSDYDIIFRVTYVIGESNVDIISQEVENVLGYIYFYSFYNTYFDFSLRNINFATYDILLDSTLSYVKNLKVDVVFDFTINDSINLYFDTNIDYNFFIQYNKTLDDLSINYDIYSQINFTNLLDVELTLSNKKMFSYNTDIYSSSMYNYSPLLVDVSVGKGCLSYINCDLVSSKEKISNCSIYSVYSCNYYIDSLFIDIQDTEGTISYFVEEIKCAKEQLVESVSYDIRLHSLYITNFSLDYKSFVYMYTYLTVDIIDYLFDVDALACYFSINGEVLISTYEVISSGIRLKCYIDDKFKHDGLFELYVHAFNVLGDTYTKKYNLLYGYNVEVYNFEFNNSEEIIVRGCATNVVECPNTECGSFKFNIRDIYNFNLNATILCTTTVDISASIEPQSTAFMYGKEYIIRIKNIKDFANNVMEELEFKFKIEDKS